MRVIVLNRSNVHEIIDYLHFHVHEMVTWWLRDQLTKVKSQFSIGSTTHLHADS